MNEPKRCEYCGKEIDYGTICSECAEKYYDKSDDKAEEDNADDKQS